MSACDGLMALNARYSRFSVRCEEEGSPPTKITAQLSDSLDNDSSVPFVKEVELLFDSVPLLQTFIVDASDLRYVSSTGIGALGSVFMAAQRHQINFFIADPSEHVTMLLKLLGFASFLPIIRKEDAR